MKYWQKIANKTILTFILCTLITSYNSSYSKALPISNDYTLPAQSWWFITITSLNESTNLQFNWSSTISVQGRAVSEEDYQILDDLDLTSRSAYFEELTFTEGIYDQGKIITNEEGEIFFVFFNPNSENALLNLNLKSNQSGLSPWAIGIITTIIVVIVLSIGPVVAKRIRDRMLKEADEELSPEQQYLQ